MTAPRAESPARPAQAPDRGPALAAARGRRGRGAALAAAALAVAAAPALLPARARADEGRAPAGAPARGAVPPAPPPAVDVAIRVGVLHTGFPEDRPLEGAVLVLRGGKVAEVRVDGSWPDDVEVLDRRHLVVTPGLVLARAPVGSGRRGDESVAARYRALDAFDAYVDEHALLAQGVTTAFLHPGRGRLVTGEGAVVKTGGPPDGRILRARGELVVDLNPSAYGPPPAVKIPVPSSSDVPIEPGEPQRPTSRLGARAELEARARAALEWEAAREGPAARRPAWDPDLAALADALVDGRLRIDARLAPDVRAAAALARGLGLLPVLEGLAEGDQAAAELAALGAALIVEVPLPLRGRALDLGRGRDRPGYDLGTAARLARAGLAPALVAPYGSEAELRLVAAAAVRGGLGPAQALAGVTTAAARALGVADRVGALTPGRDADLAFFAADPLAARGVAVETWIGGRPVWTRRGGADAVLVRAGTVVTGVGEPLRDAEVLIVGGRIAAVGSSVACPPGARVLDAGRDGVVTPGLIDAWGHLGLAGDRTAAPLEVPLHGLLGREDAASLRVARAGVTTVALAPWQVHGGGARVVARKTAESAPAGPDTARAGGPDPRRGLVLAEVCAVAFDATGGDPLAAPSQLMGRLQAGKRYHQAWVEHRQKLAAWLAEQARRAAAKVAGQAVPAPGAAGPAPAGGPRVEQTREAVTKVDPITGTWSFTISGPPVPEPQTGELALRLGPDQATIEGVARTADSPLEAPVKGTLSGQAVVLTLDVETPVGPPRVEATLDREDHLTGVVRLGPFAPAFEATRTQREAPEVRVVTRRTAGKDGRPLPPPVDPALEPLRAVFDREATLILRVDDPLRALTLLRALAPLGELRLAFAGLEDAGPALDALRAAGAALLVAPDGVAGAAWEGERAPAVDLLATDLRVGFASDAEDGACELPLRAALAVARGAAPGRVLAALTIDAARALGLDGRVGSLEPGKDGDVVVWDGPPLEPTTRVRAVLVGGRVVAD